MQRRDDGGLGSSLVGESIVLNHRTVKVSKLLGEGGFSYVYLVKDTSSDKDALQDRQSDPSKTGNGSSQSDMAFLVLKVTSIRSRQQRDIAEKEAKLLSRLSHPSIIKMYDACYRTASGPMGIAERLVGASKDRDAGAGANGKDGRPQHMILMEYCEGGHALDVCNKLAAAGQRFDLSALIIAFGQICNAVSYLHAQRPPIVHRDLKPVNFLVKNGAYKLCDFGSAVFGHVELKTQQARAEAEDVIQKTTTQMFRAPEMVDLYMAKRLTQTTDVWALGCCLYSLAFLQNCFEEGSNLAILSRNFKIPDDNPYGDGLAELLDRMLTVEWKARADMTEVILCLSAIYSGKPLPPRKKPSKSKKAEAGTEVQEEDEDDKEERVGNYRTTGQGVYTKKKMSEPKRPVEAKKLNPNSAAARRRRAAQSTETSPLPDDVMFDASFSNFPIPEQNVSLGVDEDLAFSTSHNPFAAVQTDNPEDGVDAFSSFDQETVTTEEGKKSAFEAFDVSAAWGGSGDPPEVVDRTRDSFNEYFRNGDSPETNIVAEMEGLNLVPTPDSGSEGRRRQRKPVKERKDDKPRRPSNLKGAQPENI